MLMKITLPDGRGAVQLELDYDTKKWSVQSGNGWADVGGSEGTFELPGGVLWLKDPKLGKKDQTIVIVHDAPESEGDSAHLSGRGRIYQPKEAALQDGMINWTATMSPVRQKILEICRNNLPAIGQPPKDPPNCIASKVDTGYTNCGAFPGFVARQLGYYVPWDQGMKMHAKYMQQGEKGEALWEKTRTMLKIEKQEYKYEIPEAEGKISVEGKGASFTSPMAAGWGQGRLDEYPIKLEKIRHLDPGTIWIPFKTGGRPQPGDFYVLERKLAPDQGIGFGHVGVIVDPAGARWTTADGGQGSSGFAVGYKTRKFNEQDGTLMLDPPQTSERDDGWRRLQGWVNVDKLFAGWKP